MNTVSDWAKDQFFFQYIHEKTGLSHLVIVGGFCVLAVLGLFNSTVNGILLAAIALVRPAYDTFRIIESPSTDDDTMMLRYWCVIGFVLFMNRYLGFLIEGLKIAGLIKLGIVYSLVMKKYKLSQRFYLYTIGPFLRLFDKYVGSKVNIFGKAKEFVKQVSKDVDRPAHVEDDEPIIEESKRPKKSATEYKKSN
eukprot:TRINITY_DN1691_c0_g1_i2.p1 TRINITY_DN1691_c0_g1~~TRINITY_DN1691_c0_g1_i2.p1  ORF type:complete len:206 (+),score=57.39 TRINITY_DN1691_c0_g1_i2:38-619(+)